jgi:hypothetical protein
MSIIIKNNYNKNYHPKQNQTIMKKLFFAALAIIVFTASAFAASNEVSNKVLLQFKHAYSNVNEVSWYTTTNYTRASFVQAGKQMEVFYTPDGDLMGTSEAIGFSSLPTRAITTIAKRFPANEYTVKACIQFSNANDEQTKYVSVENNKKKIVLEIDPSGNVSIFQESRK